MDKNKYKGVYECYRSLCVAMGVYESLSGLIGVWINMNSGCVYVSMCICECVRVYGGLLEAMDMAKHP